MYIVRTFFALSGSFAMNNYLIIGGSSGIGQQLANTLAANNHAVWATFYRHHSKSEHANLSYHALNVLDETLNLDFLPNRLDGLVYCPGSIHLKPFTRIKPESFIEDFRLQVGGAIRVMQSVLPKLKASEASSIVLFSTVAVQHGFSFHAQVSASKGAVEGLTRALAAELAPKIRVNCIAPSITDTPLAAQLLNSQEKRQANAQRHPLKRIGNTSDIAAMAAFLLSEQANWITGQILPVDGGMSRIKN